MTVAKGRRIVSIFARAFEASGADDIAVIAEAPIAASVERAGWIAEAWGRRAAAAVATNELRLARWQSRKALILEKDLRADHTSAYSTCLVPGADITPLRRGAQHA